VRRPTAILIVLFVLLAGLTWVMQQPNNFIKQAISSKATPVPDNRLLSPNNGAISRLEIKDASGKTLILENGSGSWVINTGKDGLADQKRAETAISLLYTMRIISQLEKAPDPAGTGLDKPDYSVSITQEARVTNFIIGKLSATGSGYYVQIAERSVSIINTDGIDALIQNMASPPFAQALTPSITTSP
jgi:hypothetical protein